MDKTNPYDAIVLAALEGPPEKEHRATKGISGDLLTRFRERRQRSDPGYLIQTAGALEAMPPDSRTRILGECMLRFDALANELQRQHRWQLAATSLVALSFLVSFEVFAHGLIGNPWVICFSLACLGIALTIVYLLRSRSIQVQYLSARIVAEILRVGFYADAAGLEFHPQIHIPRRYKHAMETPAHCVRRIYEQVHSLKAAPLTEAEILECWFAGQQKYHKQKAREMGRAERGWSTAGLIAFGISIVSFVGLTVCSFLGVTESTCGRLLLISAPSTLGLAGICKFYSERSGHKSMGERAEHSDRIYEAEDGKTWDETVADVAREAIHELVDWYVASIEREIAVPTG